MNRINTSGKRKTSIARAYIIEGNGNVFINKRNYKTFELLDRLKIEEPLRIYESVIGKKNFDIFVSVKGGGQKSQIEASRNAIARALEKFAKSKELTKAFIDYDRSLLVADTRRKEAYKPGDSKARAKRQTSYR